MRSSYAGLLAVTSAVCLTACGAGGGTGTAAIADGTHPAGGRIAFASGSISLSESAAMVAVTITRTGGNSGAVSGSVIAISGSATNNEDYAFVGSAKFSFADGDAVSKSVALMLYDDGIDEPDETLTLALNYSGAAGAGSQSMLTLTIVDDDDGPVAGPSPPVGVGLTLSQNTKQLRLTWTASATATSYKLLRQDAGSNFVQVGADLPASMASQILQIPVHKYDWSDNTPTYRVDACNAAGCTPSFNTARAFSGASLLSTGYLKGDPNAAGAALGAAVAVNSDAGGKITAAIGAPEENGNIGSVYIYQAPSSGSSVLLPQPVKISPPSTQAMRFGFAVALSRDGNTLAVGAPDDGHRQSGIGFYPAAPNSDAPSSGAVFIYTRVNGVWSIDPVYVKASDVDAQDAFGSAVALSSGGEVLVVGAPGQDSPDDSIDDLTNAATDSGAVYLAVSHNGSWSLLDGVLKASRIGIGDRFGAAVATQLMGRIIAVGAPGEDGDGSGLDPADDDSKPDSGAVYHITLDDPQAAADLVVLQSLRLKANNSGAGDAFGTSVALGSNGLVLAVGAPNEDGSSADAPNDLGNNVGAVYVFSLDPAAPFDAAYLKPRFPQDGALFGTSVALSGDANTLAAGASGESAGASGVDSGERSMVAAGAGAVDVLMRAPDTAWSAPRSDTGQHYVKALSSSAGDRFGAALALSDDGNTLLVGAPAEDGGSAGFSNNGAGSVNPTDDVATDAGAAYLY